MYEFNIKPLGQRVKAHPVIHEGRYRGGVYHLIEIDRRPCRAKFVVPEKFKDPQFIQGWDQRLPQGRMPQGKPFDIAWAKGGEFKTEGGATLKEFVRANPGVLFVSDASNHPFNEGHFAIAEGKILPLPSNSYPLQGKHYVLSTAGGQVDFLLIDVESEAEFKLVEEGFFLSKIIHEGKPIGLLDEVPGTEKRLIADFRGHIGQMFKEDAYSEMNSPEKIGIHSQLIEYLRNPQQHLTVLQDIINGCPCDFGDFGKLVLPQNTYTHTYWIEAEESMIYCLKTYPSPDGKSSAGVTFAEGPYFLLAMAREYNITVRNAFLGTNGKDVRIILLQEGKPETITTMIDGTSLGNYFERPLANFLAFLPIP